MMTRTSSVRFLCPPYQSTHNFLDGTGFLLVFSIRACHIIIIISNNGHSLIARRRRKKCTIIILITKKSDGFDKFRLPYRQQSTYRFQWKLGDNWFAWMCHSRDRPQKTDLSVRMWAPRCRRWWMKNRIFRLKWIKAKLARKANNGFGWKNTIFIAAANSNQHRNRRNKLSSVLAFINGIREGLFMRYNIDALHIH